MPFRLRKDARDWFRGIQSTLGLDFDIYYFCLMAGLATGRRTSPPASEATDLAQDFPGDYRSRGRTLVALLIARELKTLGVGYKERVTLHKEISKLIDPQSAAHLSSIGMDAMNQYSFGGFDVLTEWFEDRPRHLETFLPQLRARLHEAVSNDTASPG